jgi:hypothetical protein
VVVLEPLVDYLNVVWLQILTEELVRESGIILLSAHRVCIYTSDVFIIVQLHSMYAINPAFTYYLSMQGEHIVT